MVRAETIKKRNRFSLSQKGTTNSGSRAHTKGRSLGKRETFFLRGRSNRGQGIISDETLNVPFLRYPS